MLRGGIDLLREVTYQYLNQDTEEGKKRLNRPTKQSLRSESRSSLRRRRRAFKKGGGGGKNEGGEELRLRTPYLGAGKKSQKNNCRR